MSTLIKGDRSGIEVGYIKSRRHIYISGWYDSCVGIESMDYPIAEFLAELGITVKDMDKIKGDMFRLTLRPKEPTK